MDKEDEQRASAALKYWRTLFSDEQWNKALSEVTAAFADVRTAEQERVAEIAAEKASDLVRNMGFTKSATKREVLVAIRGNMEAK